MRSPNFLYLRWITVGKMSFSSASHSSSLLVTTVLINLQFLNIDLAESLKWLAENLEEVALDQEAEGYDPAGEGTPLVPIFDDAVEAMENELFQKVLRGVGVTPPSDEQVST